MNKRAVAAGTGAGRVLGFPPGPPRTFSTHNGGGWPGSATTAQG
jgi:hypothetical protein